MGSTGYTGRGIGRAPVACQSPKACWVADHNLNLLGSGSCTGTYMSEVKDVRELRASLSGGGHQPFWVGAGSSKR